MKKILGIILAICLLPALAACSAGTSATGSGEKVSPGYCGTWQFECALIKGVEFSREEMEVLDDEFVRIRFILKEGGMAYLTEGEDDGELLSWSETETGILLDTQELTRKDGLLHLEIDKDMICCFRKVSDNQTIEKPAEAGPTETAETTEGPAEETESTESETTAPTEPVSADGTIYVAKDFEFRYCEDGSIELLKYIGEDPIAEIYEEIAGAPVSRIGAGTFENCDHLEDVYMWAELTSIGEAAFRGCTKLKSCDVPSSVTCIEEATFENCSSLEHVFIWGDVTSIGEGAFRNCSKLKSCDISSGVTSIADFTFENCTSMEHVYIWGDVTNIGKAAFRNCTSLKSVDIPSSCTSIGESAFEGCSGLSNLYFWGDSVKCGTNAFAGCTSLKQLPKGIIYAKSAGSPEPDAETREPTQTTGLRPEFKEAMDAYEAFYEEYCDFFTEYEKDPTDLTLITKYGELMEKALEAEEAFAAWEEDELNDQELKYYLDVSNRVMQKMVDVMG